jgi:hypothetical protein
VFTNGQDFDCEEVFGIPRCKPKTIEATSAFKVLQLQLAKLLPQLPDAAHVDVDINGVIGPSTALGVQLIAKRLAEGSHKELAQISIAQPEQAIPAIAERALEIVGYVNAIMEQDPTALAMPQPLQAPEFDPLSMLRSIFTPKRIAAGVGTLVGLGALIFAGSAAHRRALGTVDRSRFLPPSDGSDDFDEGEEAEEAEHSIEPDYDHGQHRVIDAEAVELPAG